MFVYCFFIHHDPCISTFLYSLKKYSVSVIKVQKECQIPIDKEGEIEKKRWRKGMKYRMLPECSYVERESPVLMEERKK
ncbi:hypothetical protein JCM10003_3391 [Bacteroides pyogenes JCM 10003]|nr:hypothetical protein JCM10003_3391 [Bacteroides pyogenes JCM 10003]